MLLTVGMPAVLRRITFSPLGRRTWVKCRGAIIDEGWQELLICLLWNTPVLWWSVGRGGEKVERHESIAGEARAAVGAWTSGTTHLTTVSLCSDYFKSNQKTLPIFLGVFCVKEILKRCLLARLERRLLMGTAHVCSCDSAALNNAEWQRCSLKLYDIQTETRKILHKLSNTLTLLKKLTQNVTVLWHNAQCKHMASTTAWGKKLQRNFFFLINELEHNKDQVDRGANGMEL